MKGIFDRKGALQKGGNMVRRGGDEEEEKP